MEPAEPGQTTLGGLALGRDSVQSKIGLARTALLVFTSVLILSWATSAHRPLIAGPGASDPNSAPRLSNPSISRVIYYELDNRGDVQWFVIENDRPREVPVQLGVPLGSPLESAQPVIVFFGPGLDGRVEGGGIEPAVQPPWDADTGTLVLSRSDNPKPFYEPVTGTKSMILADTSVQLPSPGSYYGAVFDASGGEGKVWVGLGRREGFTWRDVGCLPGWIRDVRRFHEVPGMPRWAWIATAGLAAVVAAIVLWVMRRRLRQA